MSGSPLLQSISVFFWERVSQCSQSLPWIGDSSTSASGVLGSQVYVWCYMQLPPSLNTASTEGVDRCSLQAASEVSAAPSFLHWQCSTLHIYLHVTSSEEGHNSLLKIHFLLLGLHSSLDSCDAQSLSHMADINNWTQNFFSLCSDKTSDFSTLLIRMGIWIGAVPHPALSEVILCTL